MTSFFNAMWGESGQSETSILTFRPREKSQRKFSLVKTERIFFHKIHFFFRASTGGGGYKVGHKTAQRPYNWWTL